jgi:hypothetical protein
MHQNKNFLSIYQTKLFIQQMNKIYHASAEQIFSSNSRTKLIMHQLNKSFHPTAEQNILRIKIKTFHPTSEQNSSSIKKKPFIHPLNNFYFMHQNIDHQTDGFICKHGYIFSVNQNITPVGRF